MMSSIDNCKDFFKRYYWDEILELITDYPLRKTLVVDFRGLRIFDLEMSTELLEHSESVLKHLCEALRELDMPADGVLSEVHIAITGLPDDLLIPIHKIRKEHDEKLIAIECRILRTGEVYSIITKAAFKCQRCGEVDFMQQTEGKFAEPVECPNDDCGRKGPFKLIHDQSEFINQQKIIIQDLYESVTPGQSVREIIVHLNNDDLIDCVPGTGAQCVVTGILRRFQKTNKDGKSTSFDKYFEAIHIELKDAEIDISISDAEKKEFKALAANGDIIQTLTASIAPEILGYMVIKQSMLTTIVSGSNNENPPQRENSHVLICGDPGTAKTAMSKAPRTLVPRAQYSAGKGSSVAGLTVAAVRDELLGGGYTAQAGALVLADRSIMVLDEADKLETEDFQALNTALEEGFIEFHKGGINQTFKTRFSMIAICNPKNIRFDENEPLARQIKIPADILSRFDLVFKLTDKPEPEKDKEIANHIANQ